MDTATREKTIARHTALLTQLAQVSNCGITVFDSIAGRHVFTSYNFENLFGYDMRRAEELDIEYVNTFVHPDDLPVLDHNGRVVAEYFTREEHRAKMGYSKFISEYRMRRTDGSWMRVIEQMRPLEFAPDGMPWLTLSVLDLAPDQTPLTGVRSKLIDCRTGEMYHLPEFIARPSEMPGAGAADAPALSGREKDILRLVREGLLSKEISDQLDISVHTVNTHRQRILEKLGVDNSMEAVRYASQYGLLD